jgi:hypothetical protein
MKLYCKYEYIFKIANILQIQLYRNYENIIILLKFAIKIQNFLANFYMCKCKNL